MSTFFMKLERADLRDASKTSTPYYCVLGCESKSDCLVIVGDERGGRVCWWDEFKLALGYAIEVQKESDWRYWLDTRQKAWLPTSKSEPKSGVAVAELIPIWEAYCRQWHVGATFEEMTSKEHCHTLAVLSAPLAAHPSAQ